MVATVMCKPSVSRRTRIRRAARRARRGDIRIARVRARHAFESAPDACGAAFSKLAHRVDEHVVLALQRRAIASRRSAKRRSTTFSQKKFCGLTKALISALVM